MLSMVLFVRDSPEVKHCAKPLTSELSEYSLYRFTSSENYSKDDEENSLIDICTNGYFLSLGRHMIRHGTSWDKHETGDKTCYVNLTFVAL